MNSDYKLKEMFFGQYFSQEVFCDINEGLENVNCQTLLSYVGDISENSFVKLKSIEDISDEDAIRVAQLVHQIDGIFSINRVNKEDFIIHLEKETDVLTYHISINKYCSINSNWHFKQTEEFPQECSKINIGEIITTSKKPIPYIAIVDFLRSKGYAIPYNGLSVESLVNLGWVILE